MFPTDQPTAASALPTPAAAGTQGFFTGGNPASGTPATVLDPDWLNMIQQELINIVAAGGETPSKTTYDQVLAAIKTLIGQPQNNLVSGVVGQARNAKMSVAGASVSATFSADEIIVEAALGGLRYCLPSYSQTINLATTGAGGMDTGTAPAPGYVALYAIYDPTTNTQSILATNATSAAAPSVYGGSHMPSGYTASALISVWTTNSSGQFVAGTQIDRIVGIPSVSALNASTTQASVTALSISSAVPPNARKVSGTLGVASTSPTQNTSLIVYAMGAIVGVQGINNSTGSAGGSSAIFKDLTMAVAQTMYYTASSGSGTPTFTISISSYEF